MVKIFNIFDLLCIRVILDAFAMLLKIRGKNLFAQSHFVDLLDVAFGFRLRPASYDPTSRRGKSTQQVRKADDVLSFS